MFKVVILIIGGLADHAVDGLGRRTPLQVARTPNLDHLAILGGCGIYHPTKVGQVISPELSLFITLGNKIDEFPGRASLEALGREFKLKTGTYYVILEPVVVERNTLIERKPFESDEEEENFYLFLKENLGFVERLDSGVYLYEADCFIPTTHPLVIGRKLKLPEKLEKNCSPFDLPKNWQENESRVKRGLQPVNYLLSYGCGKYVEKQHPYYNLDLLFITDSYFMKGLAKWMHLDCKFFTEEKPRELMINMLKEACKNIENYDGIVIYTDLIHRKNIQFRAWKRVEVIEEMDKALSMVIDKILAEEVILLLTTDATTPSTGNLPYSGAPVPFIMAGEGVRRGIATKFDEATAATGSFGILRGEELLLTLLSYAGYSDTESSIP